MPPGSILWWAKAFPGSRWSVDKMSHRTFDYLVHTISRMEVEVSRSDYDILCSIGFFEPLASCAEYQAFTRDLLSAKFTPGQSALHEVGHYEQHSDSLPSIFNNLSPAIRTGLDWSSGRVMNWNENCIGINTLPVQQGQGKSTP